MKAKILFGLLCVITTISANAAIPYRAQQVIMPAPDNSNDTGSFAREHPFYIGASYDFNMWDSYTDDSGVEISGKNTTSFDAVAGVRLYDVFRIEANYIYANAEYNAFKLTGNTAMINAIFDARVGSLYRLFYRQHLVPYVGLGGGLSWNKAESAHLDNKVSPVVSIMAGLGLEFGEYLAFDFGYKYLYIVNPKFDSVSDFSPTANQFRVGVRVNF